MRAKKPSFVLGLSLLVVCCLTKFGHARILRIGVVIDGPWERNQEILQLFEDEIRALLGSEYDVTFPPDAVRTSDWTVMGIQSQLDTLLSNPEIELVIALGVVASNDAARRSHLPKPTIAPFIIDAQMQGIPASGSTSGVKNLSYITWPDRVFRDLEAFQSIVDFNHVVMLSTREIQATVPGMEERCQSIASRLGFRLTLVPVDTSVVEALAAIPDDADAVYLAPLLRLADGAINQLALGLIERSLPSFSMLGEREVEDGILASLGLQSNFDRVARRTALHIQRIVHGEDAGALSSVMRRDEHLTINMATARAIGLSPAWSVLTEAKVINDVRGEGGYHLTLSHAIDTALTRNPELMSAESRVAAGGQHVVRARARLLPQIELSALGTVIDEDRAASSFGAASERELSGILEGTQLLFSEGAWANLSIQKRLQQALEAQLQQLRLDIVSQTASAYLSLLRAQTLEKIEQDNVRLTRSHLQLAEIRLSVGTAGQAEVYRWQSELASGQKRAIEANSNRNLAEIALNQLLRRPLEAPFTIEEVGLGDSSLLTSDQRILRFLSNPAAFREFRRLMSEDAEKQSPEIRQIDATVAAQRRALTSARRTFFIPTVGLSAGVTRSFDQSGAGADFQIPFPDLGPGADETDWTLSFKVSLPLFRGGSRIADMSQARHTLTQLEHDRALTAQRVEKRLRAALHAFGASYAGISLARTAADAARRNLDLASDAYARGAVSILDLLDAQNAALVAEQIAADAVYNCLSDWIEVERASGRMSHFMSPENRARWLESMEQRMQAAGARP